MFSLESAQCQKSWCLSLPTMSLPSACSDTQFIHLSDNSKTFLVKPLSDLSLSKGLYLCLSRAPIMSMPGQEGRLDSVNGLSRDFPLHQFRRKEKFFSFFGVFHPELSSTRQQNQASLIKDWRIKLVSVRSQLALASLPILYR